MANFFNSFQERIINPNIVDVILNYSSNRNHFKKHCFIEGIDDKKFYSSFLYKILNVDEKEVCFINCGCKHNVKNSLEYFVNNKNRINNCYFIVDRDYDTISNDSIMKSKLTITKYYSIENYYFVPENMMQILQMSKLQHIEIDLFKKKFKEYIDLIIDFETIMLMNSKYNINANLEFVELKENLYINNFAPVLMKNFSQKICEIIKTFNVQKTNIFNDEKETLRNNFLYIRGHDLELFFDLFMESLFVDIKLKDIIKNKEMNKIIKIEIDLK